jgi:hypothetical protein
MQRARELCVKGGNPKGTDMRSGCLWLLGVPIPIIILLWLFFR